MRRGLGFHARHSPGGFNPGSLFTGGIQGAWYDPSDLTTLFQDSAGTTPVTAVEQPVGLMLDKSGRGNHAFQTTSASRPTLRARYNLLERSEDFSNAYWTKSGTAVNTAAGVAPDGTNTANKIYPTSTGAFRQVFRTLTTVAISYVATVYAKAAEKSVIAFVDFAGGAGAAWFNLSTGVASNVVAGYTATITSVGNGWYRCSLTGTAPAGLGYYSIFIADSAGGSNVTANGTDGVLLWGAQLTQPAVFPTNTYQRVGAATDYATGAAFPPYLFFDGVDDSMLTNSVDFSGTDKMLVVAGVTKQSTGAGSIVELSATAANPGTFNLFANGVAVNDYFFGLNGTNLLYGNNTSFAPPVSNVLTEQLNQAGATDAQRVAARSNGTSLALTYGGSIGTPGNFGNYPLYIGRRNNATLPFNGSLFSLIIAGQSYAAGQITSTEQWVAARTPLGSI